MPDQKLTDYIKAEELKGVDRNAIVSSLLAAGWTKLQIDQAFSSVEPQPGMTPVTQPAVTTSSENNPEIESEIKSGNGKKIIIGIVIFLFFLLVSVATSLVLFAYDKLPYKNFEMQNKIADVVMKIPFMPKTPRFVLETSAKEHLKVTKLSFDASVASDASDFASVLGSGNFDLHLVGKFDYADISDPLLDLTATVNKDYNANLLVKDQILYFKINSVPQLTKTLMASNGFPETIQNKVLGRWIYYNIAREDTDARTSLNQNKDNQIQKAFEDYLEALNDKELLDKLSMVEEKIGNVSTYHINFTPNDENLDYYWEKYTKSDKCKGCSINKISDDIKNFKMDLWIDKKTYLVQKSTIVFVYKYPNYGYYNSTGMNIMQNNDKNVSISISFSDFNKPVEVSVPEDAVEVEVLMKELMQEMDTQKKDSVDSSSLDYYKSSILKWTSDFGL